MYNKRNEKYPEWCRIFFIDRNVLGPTKNHRDPRVDRPFGPVVLTIFGKRLDGLGQRRISRDGDHSCHWWRFANLWFVAACSGKRRTCCPHGFKWQEWSPSRELLRIRPELPIILCTGFSHIMTAEKAKTLGIQAYLMKPLAIRDLAPIVRHVLDRTLSPLAWHYIGYHGYLSKEFHVAERLNHV